jgi:hypothetical protein
MKLRSIRLEIGRSGHDTRIWIDGVEIENCYRVMFDVAVDRVPVVTIALRGVPTEITGEAGVVEVVTPPNNEAQPQEENHEPE